IGREFTCRLLAAVAPIAGNSLQLALEQLTRAGLIFCRRIPRISSSTPCCRMQRTRACCGGGASNWLSSASAIQRCSSPSWRRHKPQLMAHHLAQGGLTELAINYLRKAGQCANESSTARSRNELLRLSEKLTQVMSPS